MKLVRSDTQNHDFHISLNIYKQSMIDMSIQNLKFRINFVVDTASCCEFIEEWPPVQDKCKRCNIPDAIT